MSTIDIRNMWATLQTWTKNAKGVVSAIAGCLIALMVCTSIAYPAPIEKCTGSYRFTCVVDGDTIWLQQEKLRLMGYDTPEPQTNVCGGDFERQLADKATSRLVQLLSNNDWTVETFGKDRYGRTLATIRVQGEDVGDILIREGLARRWPDGEEWWCPAD